MPWPTLDMLRQQLGATGDLPAERVAILEQALGAAVEGVQVDLGRDLELEEEDEGYAHHGPLLEEEVTDRLAAAALHLAVSVTKAPEAPFGVAAVFDAGGLYVARQDPNYRRLLKGHRVRFGVA